MKKVVSENQDVIHVDFVKSSKYYGVIINKKKAFILRDSYQGKFIVSFPDDITNGNSMNLPKKEFEILSLKPLITYLMDKNHHSVFEFDSFKELMVWVLDVNLM